MNPTLLLVVLLVAVVLWVSLRGSSRARYEARLTRICQGDVAQAERLLQAEMSRFPGMSREEAAARAVQRFERDNR